MERRKLNSALFMAFFSIRSAAKMIHDIADDVIRALQDEQNKHEQTEGGE